MARPTIRSLFALALLLVACGGDEPPPPVVAPASERTLVQGRVVGFERDGAHAWRGIPFAQPPVGPLRWKPPESASGWEGVREALAFGDACPQLDRDGAFVGSEDCLVLNVFAPAVAKDALPEGDARWPVMVFIHGGGQSIGSAEMYDGARLAAENGVVVVTVHYRLGVLGWFAHPAVAGDDASPEAASGNFATLDLIEALRWVRDNASAFGGDPDRVTIFGESAGGINIYSLLLAPAAKGLFHRAISQSGFPTTFTMTQARNAVDDEPPGEGNSATEVLLSHLQADGRAADREAARAALASMSSGEIDAYLRGKSAEQLLSIFARSDGAAMGGGMYVAPFVLRDGVVIPDRHPLESFAAGQYNVVPFIAGTNRDENKLFLAFLSPHVRHAFGMPVGFKDADRYDVVAEYGSTLWKASGVDEPVAAMRAHQGPSVYAYRFDWDEEASFLWLDVPRLIGAAHAVELLFVFGGTRSDFAERWFVEDVETADRLSAQMRSYWAAFAKDGAPGSGQDGTLPAWKPFDAASGAPSTLILDTEAGGGVRMESGALTTEQVMARVATDPRLPDTASRCEVYQAFAMWSDALTPEAYTRLEDGGCAAHPMPGRTAFD